MRYEVLGQSSPGKTIEQGKKRLLNMYMVQNDDDQQFSVIAHTRPGLTAWAEVTGNSVRALYSQNEVLYAVVDNRFYVVSSTGTFTAYGTLSTSSGVCQIVGNVVELLINDGANRYVFTIATNAFATLTEDPTVTVTAQDGYFMSHSGAYFALSGLLDGDSWDATDVASAEGNPDDILAVASFQRRLFLFGRITTEVWFNSGATDFPFSRVDGLYINYGIAASSSVGVCDNQIIWLARGINGQLAVVSINQSYEDINIATKELCGELESYTVTEDAQAFVYQLEGKEFYVLSFPTQNKTWVYDLDLRLWAEYSTVSAGIEQRWLANSHTFVYNKHLCGDYSSGKIYQLDKSSVKDGTNVIKKEILTKPFYSEKVVFVNRLELDVVTGAGSEDLTLTTDPQILLQVSLDGGHTFSNVRTTSLGVVGENMKRIRFARLGSGRKLVFKITVTDPVKFTVLGAWLDVKEGRE